jgi:hypothetical protein
MFNCKKYSLVLFSTVFRIGLLRFVDAVFKAQGVQ